MNRERMFWFRASGLLVEGLGTFMPTNNPEAPTQVSPALRRQRCGFEAFACFLLKVPV